MPAQPVRTVSLIGAGLDHVCYDIDGELIVRAARKPDPGRLHREIRLLATVAQVSPLPVPRPLFAVDGWCLGYRKLPGIPLLDLPPETRAAYATPVAAAVGTLLDRLHTTPASRWAAVAEVDDRPLVEWQREAAGYAAGLTAAIPAAHDRAITDFLATEPPSDRYSPVFSHNDLGIEHVLVDPTDGAVTGVIDWSDAALIDPAADFGLIYRDLGPDALDRALRGYSAAGNELAALRERARFHGRCRVFEDLAYGVEAGQDRYVATSLAALDWLFPR